MKKFIVLFALLIGFVSVNAQTATLISRVNNYFEWTGSAAHDTVGGTVTTWSKPILLGGDQVVYYYSKVKVTETAGFACTIKLQGKYFDSDTYTDITTITYGGAGADTTAIFAEASTPIKYRYLNVLVTRTAGTGKVTSVKLVAKRP